ncbi:MAG: hypothetical protein QNK37_14985 [Acidobacteriota bacterium]|nr:hypothetical protein [Acidobacteriota bacterium]
MEEKNEKGSSSPSVRSGLGTRVDGRTIGEGQVDPMTDRLSALFAELVKRSGDRVVD